MNRRHLYGLALSLTALGLGLFLYKTFALGFPLSPATTVQIWDVEIRIRFWADGGPVKLQLHIPSNSRKLAVIDEGFVSRRYGLSTVYDQGNRRAVWSIRRAAGEQVLYYRAAVQRVSGSEKADGSTPPSVEPPAMDEIRLAAARGLLAEIKEHSADLDTLVAQLVQSVNSPEAGSNADLLLTKKDTVLKRLEVATQLLALDNVPARLVRGVRLETASSGASPIPWLQVHDGKVWRGYDPGTGQRTYPDDFLILWRGFQPLVELSGGENATTRLSVRSSEEAGISAAVERGELIAPQLQAFSMLSLPIRTQEVYRVLLMIPIGALLLVLLRNVVGVKTFGTFMPVLIGLAFRETQLIAGVVLFTVLVALGLTVRFYLEHLKLLLVPRLAALLVIVVGLMALVSVLSHRLGFETGLFVSLFPMVIITMTIERMSIVWEERGAAEALQQGLGSLLVAALAYLLMSNQYVGHLMFVFPELLLILLAVMLLLGRYAGYRLLELRRFRVLAKLDAKAGS